MNWCASRWSCVLVVSPVIATQVVAAPAHPLKVSANGRYLVGSNNLPRLLTGDSRQTLFGN